MCPDDRQHDETCRDLHETMVDGWPLVPEDHWRGDRAVDVRAQLIAAMPREWTTALIRDRVADALVPLFIERGAAMTAAPTGPESRTDAAVER